MRNVLNIGQMTLYTETKKIETIADNISNSNTRGFKSTELQETPGFSQVLQTSTPSNGNFPGSSAIQIGTGVTIGGTVTDFTHGPVEQTNQNFDLTILSDNGFFKVRDSSTNTYLVTRTGNFGLDDQSYLTTIDKRRVQGIVGGDIVFTVTNTGTVEAPTLVYTPAITALTDGVLADIMLDTDITVASGRIVDGTGGTISTDLLNASAPAVTDTSVDQFGNIIFSLNTGTSYTRAQIMLTDFVDYQNLIHMGGGYYSGFVAANELNGGAVSAAVNAPGSQSFGIVVAGQLEGSNVDLGTQFTNLIKAEKTLQGGARIITVSDRLLEEIINLKR